MTSPRIIPAPAGNTEYLGLAQTLRADHPRACGEHAILKPVNPTVSGSSPRLWGTHPPSTHQAPSGRIIPAPAGNTVAPRRMRFTSPDHPRACGEHLPGNPDTRMYRGSSPRLRGTRRGHAQGVRAHRIIPAPAGNTLPGSLYGQHRPDHPRACGEHRGCGHDHSRHTGSSPRLRGTRRDAVASGRFARIIPAPAGNTSLLPTRWPRATDHPRACGEHAGRPGGHAGRHGSSPRLRGTRPHRPHTKPGRRIIPAPAGNAVAVFPTSPACPDHPRACGERHSPILPASLASGSSPRLRGTPGLETKRGWPQRIIPAPAGNAMISTSLVMS